ncbi:MAG TPA: hypothetical protein VLH59_10235 [Ignavibacteriaceae bacterium]|nr:hypothetical protein [Ignavibacteriaceae bacterium]
MLKLFFLFLITTTALIYSQANQQKVQITSSEFEIPANMLTKIVLYNSDSTNSFTLFDNIIEQRQKVIFIIQPTFFTEKSNYKNEIVLPFPKIESGMYSIHYSNKDTSFVKKWSSLNNDPI